MGIDMVPYTYEDALKRLTDTELEHMQKAIKKFSNEESCIEKESFFKNVLRESVPEAVAERIFTVMGGTDKGILFKELVCGLVLITKGEVDQKIKFLFDLYSMGSGCIVKEDFARLLQATESVVSDVDLFTEGKERVTYEEFHGWLLANPNILSLSHWIHTDLNAPSISNDQEPVSLYKTLAEVTHLLEGEIVQLEKFYNTVLKKKSSSGKLDLKTLRPLVSPPIPISVCDGLFNAFDENKDDDIDFKEMALGVSAAARGSMIERIEFCFKVFDLDRDGYLSNSELEECVSAFNQMHLESGGDCNWNNRQTITAELRSVATEKGLSVEAFLVWALDNPLVAEFLEMILQVCHVVLGLSPLTKCDECRIVNSWLVREKERGFRVGQFWYVMASDWLRQWLCYVTQDIIQNVVGTGIRQSDSDPPASSLSHGPSTPRRSVSKPGPIDNSSLVCPPMVGVRTLTKEGVLKELANDFEIIPEALWESMSHWYGGSPVLRREVILNEGRLGVEIYPLTLRLLLHQTPSQAVDPPQPGPSDSKLAALSPKPAKRHLAYLATFSIIATVGQIHAFLCEELGYKKDEMRLWFCPPEEDMVLLDDPQATLSDIGFFQDDEVLIETSNVDHSWPEGMASDSNKGPRIPPAVQKGCTGLENMGNSCYLSSTVQCVSNTRVLTRYFTGGFHMYELNRGSTSGGHIANKFGELMQELWAGTREWCRPVKLRKVITHFNNFFEGNFQQDASELLTVLLQALGDDLNRVYNSNFQPPVPTPGLPDVEAAKEAHENFILHRRSIINDVFTGQIKNTVKCLTCRRKSARFETFTMLTLPIPLDTSIHLLVVVIRLDGSIPTKFSIKLKPEENNMNLKENLSSLCDVPPLFLQLAIISGSGSIQCILQDESSVRPVPQGSELFAYELPAYDPSSVCDEERISIDSPKSQCTESQTLQAIQASTQPQMTPDVPPPGPVPDASLDDSASTASVSDCASPTKGESGSIQVDSGDCSGDCSARTCSLADSMNTSSGHHPHNFIVAFNRKLNVQNVSSMTDHKSVPILFGLPLIVPCSESTTNQDLYQDVLRQVNRLVSPLPPSETAPPNQAIDCGDSLGYEFPFTLKSVNKEGSACSICSWTRTCQGCSIPCSESKFNRTSVHIGIDWDATALSRYQPSQERAYTEHASVAQHKYRNLGSLNLDDCFRAYTKEEMLGEGSRYYCELCSSRQLASMKSEIWKLPPCLIVILRRFEFNSIKNEWDKSGTIVDFPYKDFDPTEYLAKIPRKTILKHQQNLLNSSSSSSGSDHRSPVSKKIRLSPSAEAVEGPLQDFHQHLLNDNADPFNLKYNLYAYVAHSGTLETGHYMSYAKNPNTKWYWYNDSICKEIENMDSVNKKYAYMLFYEREGLDIERYMPSIVDRDPPDLTLLRIDEESLGFL